jgi:signal transduction histidine kinase
MRGRFFRRVGCFLFVVVLGIATLAVLLVTLVLQLLGLQTVSSSFGILLAALLVVVLLGMGLLFVIARSIRRYSLNFGDLLDASERISAGDYGARVGERGPEELRSLGRAFNRMASRLQAEDEQRRSLLADVTHELRTPLAVIQGNVEGILDGVYLPDEAHLRTILEETQLLARLVDDLRTLSLAQSGTLQLRKEPVDLAALLSEVISASQAQAASAGVSLTTDLPHGLPTVEYDPQRMREVFSNLLDNSLRYTPPGGSITVRCRLDTLPAGSWLVTEIQDSGAGMPPEMLEHIFDRYYKAQDSVGMGLGLAIARSLVEAHGGKIAAESQPGHGTRLQVSLPV